MFWVALLLGTIEGITEFLPISSTGHLKIASEAIGFQGERAEVFQVFIQLGAILSVVWEYRHRLTRIVLDAPTVPEARGFVGNLVIAFVPAGLVGYFLGDFITEHLFTLETVAAALIAGALAILLVEHRPRPVLTRSVDAVTWRQALLIGLAQCLAILFPGFSRSTATILGGLGIGLERRVATEFSFFLAIPVMFAATGYHLLKNYHLLSAQDAGWLALTFALSFVVAWATVRWLLRFIVSHDFRIFAWYRLLLGLAMLLWLGLGR